MDRGVLHQLSDPLMQLVRNAVDHGIEPPEERVRADKRAEGTIRLRAMQLDSDVVISVTDDGRGLDGSVAARASTSSGRASRRFMAGSRCNPNPAPVPSTGSSFPSIRSRHHPR